VAGGLSNENHARVSDDLRTKFGDRMRALRGRLGISQEELADRCGLHRTYFGGIERGERNPSLVSIGRIADALQVGIVELFRFPAGRPKPK
jgi:transcriptional regulator with XRE-family HTH domain